MKSCQTSWKLPPPRLGGSFRCTWPRTYRNDSRSIKTVPMPLPVDINLSRPVHFAELESGVFTVFHPLISSHDRQGGRGEVIKRYGVPFRVVATMQIIGCRSLSSEREKKRRIIMTSCSSALY